MTRAIALLAAVMYVSASILVAASVGSYEQLSEPARVLGPWAVGGLTVYGVPRFKAYLRGEA